MKILLSGQKYFGAEALRLIMEIDGVEVVLVCAPKGDRLYEFARVHRIKTMVSGTLNAETMPDGIDLIVTAHSHDFIGERTRLKARYGGIGYHPSLLPIHRGRDAVKWTIKFNEKVTGGTVYRLSNKVDGGNIIKQETVFVRPEYGARELWEMSLCKIGHKLLIEVIKEFRDSGLIMGHEQDESLSTFEPSFSSAPLHKPDLVMIGAD